MKLGVENFFSKSAKVGRFWILHSKLPVFLGGWVLFLSKKTTFFGDFLENLGKRKFWLKRPSLARSVPKPLKVPSFARSVPKPLIVPSLARSVPKAFKMGQEGEGAKRHYALRHEPLLLFTAALLVGSECGTRLKPPWINPQPYPESPVPISV